MRLSEDKIKAGILHSEQDVRDAAALYFSRSYTEDESVMPIAIEAIERYGWDEAFETPICIEGLPLNDATLRWVLKQLQHKNVKIDSDQWGGRWHTLNSLLSSADAHLLARHKQAILATANLKDETRENVVRRTDLLSADAEACWQELEQLSVLWKDVDDIGDVDLDHASALIEAIAREKQAYGEKVLAVLQEEVEDVAGNPRIWMEQFATQLAGEMRLEPAIPRLIAKLGTVPEDADLFNEECSASLAKIGTDDAVQAVADLYRQGNWHLRMTACHGLQHIHSDLAVSTALELLNQEEDGTLRAFLGAALASQFAFEAIEPLRQMVLDGTYDETFADLKRQVVVATTLMGAELPELTQWKVDVEKKKLELERRRLKWEKAEVEQEIRLIRPRAQEEYDEESLPPRKIGRNDPCPCGSGKKFKKCCMNKGVFD